MSKLDATSEQTLHALILSDGKMGDLAQCRGVAQALDATTSEIIVSPGPVAALLHSMGADKQFHDQLDALTIKPHLVLASGRRTVPYLKAVKSKWGDQILTVFLKDPRAGANTADLIWVPTHDRLRADNVVVTDTGPHGHTLEKQAEAARKMEERLAGTSYTHGRPWLGVLLGGVTKQVRYDTATIASFLKALETASSGAGSVLVTPSRRTPEALLEAIKAAHTNAWIWDRSGDNPYSGMLGACDAFLVTGDSHNMVSEVLSTGSQVMVFRPSGLPAKFTHFLDTLTEKGHICVPTQADFAHRQEPIDATPIIASHIRDALSAHTKNQ